MVGGFYRMQSTDKNRRDFCSAGKGILIPFITRP